MNSVKHLLGVKYPVIQAGMVWCSGWELASACSNSGILGVIGSGSMYPDVLRHHIRRTKGETKYPFAVNIPLLYPDIDAHIKTVIEEKVPIVITSAGSPAKYTSLLKEQGVRVLHVVSSARFAKKAEEAGVDGIICEGFEAGGHNGREETTTLCLIPAVRKVTKLPLVAAGGISTGKAMLAAMILGADGVQIGSRFVASLESSAHQKFKDLVVISDEGATELTLKELAPVRLIKNDFYSEIQFAYMRGAGPQELKDLLGKGRAKKGMFEGDLKQGELEIGQIASLIKEVLPAKDIVREIIEEFGETFQSLSKIKEDTLW